MSKTVTLTDLEIEQIILGLTALRDESVLGHVGQRAYDQIIDKLKAASSDKPTEQEEGIV